MRNTLARIGWAAAGVLALSLAAAGAARADTVYFKNGTTMWGEEVEEQGDQVSIIRGGQPLKFPKADVLRIEKRRTNMPAYNVDLPPAPGAGAPARGGPGAPPGGPAAGPPPAVSPTGPSGPQGAIPMPGSSAPQGAIPIPGAEAGGPPQPPYGPPGVMPPTGTPR
jgi:hypothetical protein